MADLRLLDESSWLEAWRRLDSSTRSVFLHPGYYRALAAISAGRLGCAYYEGDSGAFLYPFVQRDLTSLPFVEDESCDIQGGYGYNSLGVGSVAAGPGLDHDRAGFEARWREFCRSENVIFEYARLNPMLSDAGGSHFDEEVPVSSVLVVDLTRSDLLTDSYQKSVLKKIRKATAAAIVVDVLDSVEVTDDALAEFAQLQDASVRRHGTEVVQAFSAEFLGQLRDELPSHARWFFARDGSSIVAAEVALYDDNAAYSFIGGTWPASLPSGAMSLLRHEVNLSFQQDGLKSLCLGGGVRPGDSIEYFKSNFTPVPARPFRVGLTTHDKRRYAATLDGWRRRYPEKSDRHGHLALCYWR